MQEAHDLAAIAHAATLAARIPFLHFFDGFRTSHEVAKIDELSRRRPARDDRRRAAIAAHRERALTPDHPCSAARPRTPTRSSRRAKRATRFYDACPAIVQDAMDRFAAAHRPAVPPVRLRRRPRRPSASSCSWAPAPRRRTRRSSALVAARREGGRAEGAAVPAVLASTISSPRCRARVASDRGARPHQGAGRVGEPLYQDVVTALREARETGMPSRARAADRRRALRAVVARNSRRRWSRRSSTSWRRRSRKQPLHRRHRRRRHAPVAAVRPRLRHRARRRASAPSSSAWRRRHGRANKNSIKIIGEETDNYAAGLLRLRLQEVRRRSRSRTCASARGRSARRT